MTTFEELREAENAEAAARALVYKLKQELKNQAPFKRGELVTYIEKPGGVVKICFIKEVIIRDTAYKYHLGALKNDGTPHANKTIAYYVTPEKLGILRSISKPTQDDEY